MTNIRSKHDIPSVSVIIPTYNRANYVTMAIDSVLTQTYTDYEIIVVDDGSTDNTKEVLQPYMDKIHYIFQSNKGVSAARNTGIRAATGEWIAFLDSDDVWLPTKLETQLADIEHFKDADLHICNGLFVEGEMAQDMFLLRGLQFKKKSIKCIERPFFHFLKFGYACLPCTLVKNKNVYFDEAISNLEDFHYMARIALCSKKWLLRDEKMVHFIRRMEDPGLSLTQRNKGNSINTLSEQKEVFDKLEHFIREKGYPAETLRAVRIARSNAYFNFAAKCGDWHEAKVYLLKGMLEHRTLRNILKYFVYYGKTWVRQSRAS